MADPKKSDSESISIEGAAESANADQALELINEIEIDLEGKLPKQDQGKVMRVVREKVERRAAYFSGPQPPPELIAEYEKVAPGWGLRILEMGEREQLHRHECDKRILAQNERELDHAALWISYSGRGQILGFIAFLIIGAIGVYATYLHLVAIACVCFGTFAIGVITTFIKGPARETVDDQPSPQPKSDPKNES